MAYYFAYGSLMDLNFVKKLAVHYKKECSAKLIGYEVQINVQDSIKPDYGYANVIPNPNSTVEGVLLEISDEHLLLLDSYEGYPELYSRFELEIHCTNNKKKYKAWVYSGNSNYVVDRNLKLTRTQKQRIQSGFPFLSIEYQKKILKII